MRGTVLATQVQLKFLEDHPRSCGEQLVLCPQFLHFPGSPPLMRGTVVERILTKRVARITPAHAGNSLQSYTLYGRVQDHPRSCGEQWRLSPYPAQVLGSPPLMRGTVCKIPQKRHRTGITPAHAGNSRLIYHHVERYGDHPRSCGEQWDTSTWHSRRRGSPPLMRGTAFLKLPECFYEGITPAHAGNSIAPSSTVAAK